MQLLTISAGILALFFTAAAAFLSGYNFYKIREARKKSEESTALVTIGHTTPFEPASIPEYAEIIEGKRYSTLDAKCIAQGIGFFGRWWLCKTNNDNYFCLSALLIGQAIQPYTEENAIKIFTAAGKREVTFEQAFPNVKVVDA